jgi:hypothetical protein
VLARPAHLTSPVASRWPVQPNAIEVSCEPLPGPSISPAERLAGAVLSCCLLDSCNVSLYHRAGAASVAGNVRRIGVNPMPADAVYLEFVPPDAQHIVDPNFMRNKAGGEHYGSKPLSSAIYHSPIARGNCPGVPLDQVSRSCGELHPQRAVSASQEANEKRQRVGERQSGRGAGIGAPQVGYAASTAAYPPINLPGLARERHQPALPLKCRTPRSPPWMRRSIACNQPGEQRRNQSSRQRRSKGL